MLDFPNIGKHADRFHRTMNRLREALKWQLFPGINLHARLRYRVLPSMFGQPSPAEERRFLDAGCGNGMLTYAAYRCGFRARGLSIKADEVARCRRLFNEFLRIPETHLRFDVRNLYDLDETDGLYDEIVCSEVLEHLRDDVGVLQKFRARLRDGGTLHLCVPNAEHPDHRSHHLDEAESGGHVRAGYTPEDLHRLLEPLGFRMVQQLGLGGPIRQWFNKYLIELDRRFGWIAAFPLFLIAQAVVWTDPAAPRTPYSIYVRAIKEHSGKAFG